MICAFRALFLAAVCSLVMLGQTCAVSFSDDEDGSSAAFNNRQKGCTTWTLTYATSGGATVSVAIEQALDVNGSPGTWVPWFGAPVVGSLPSTDVNGLVVVGPSYVPWVRVSWTLMGGTNPRIVGSLQGAGYLSGGGGGGSVPDPLAVIGEYEQGDDFGATTPPVVTGRIGSDRAVQADFACTQQAVVSATSSGNTLLLAGVAGQTLRVCHLSFSMDGTADVKIVSGTGMACADGAADVTGVYPQIDALALDFGAVSALRAPSAEDLCLNLSGAVNLGGVVIYASF